jgi:uncharacterized protein (DUF1810 family)
MATGRLRVPAQSYEPDGRDPFDLQRFVTAQDADGTFARAVLELEAGRKSTHWMWFVFPQIRGLGVSATARRFAIMSVDEARDYVGHEVLGPRLRRCAGVLTRLEGRSAVQVFGPIDAQKLQSSMTLFMRACPDEWLWRHVLDRYFEGQADRSTDRLLGDGTNDSSR